MTVRIACAQINPVVGAVSENRDRILDGLSRARDAGADLVLFPELAIAGYPPEDLLLKPHFVEMCERALADIAAEARGIVAIVGTPVFDQDVYNAAAVCADGEVGLVYKKVHLPNYGVFDERRYFHAGESADVITLRGEGFGLTICEDIWVTDGPYVDAAVTGRASAILNISASPFHARKTEQRERMLRQRAVDNGVFVIFCNLVGGQDELVFDGVSCVIDVEGNVVARAAAFEEQLLITDLDLERASHGRLRDPRHRDASPARRAHAAPVRVTPVPVVGTRPSNPVEPVVEAIPDTTDLLLRALTTGVGDYVRKNGFTGVLVGISGGIDSALVAAIACRALGPENVWGVFMPSRFSSDDSLEDSQALAAELGFRLTTIPIEDAFGAFGDALRPVMGDRPPNTTEENIQARIRGVLLMALSNQFGHLVLATGNKSEMSVGYATLYGDMCGAFAPIKDVSKTRVYDLCRRVNELAESDLIPARILTKAPTAELRENQKDSDSLPEYAVLDDILEMYVEEELSLAQMVERGADRETASWVIRQVGRSEYKRRQAAPGVKITPLAFGKDRRLPITEGFGRFESGERDGGE